ncbi:MAG: hypothetical protein WD534_14935 [Phycisphaeraceae bacterium]
MATPVNSSRVCSRRSISSPVVTLPASQQISQTTGTSLEAP